MCMYVCQPPTQAWSPRTHAGRQSQWSANTMKRDRPREKKMQNEREKKKVCTYNVDLCAGTMCSHLAKEQFFFFAVRGCTAERRVTEKFQDAVPSSRRVKMMSATLSMCGVVGPHGLKYVRPIFAVVDPRPSRMLLSRRYSLSLARC